MALIGYRPLNSRPSMTCKMREAGPGAASTEPSVDLPVNENGIRVGYLPGMEGRGFDKTASDRESAFSARAASFGSSSMSPGHREKISQSHRTALREFREMQTYEECSQLDFAEDLGLRRSDEHPLIQTQYTNGSYHDRERRALAGFRLKVQSTNR